jgi:outer membrane protein with beta-barrel domain/thrombospondin type 3 repeat protein
MNRNRCIVLAALLCCALPAFAGGGDIHEIEVGLYAGAMSPDNYNGLNPEGTTFYGVRGGYFFTPKWSVEGAYQWSSTQADVSGPNPDMDLNSLRFNGLWNLRAGKKFRWFLTAGLGREYTKASDLNLDEKSWSYNFGGGARWYFGKKKNWGFRADARWISANVGGSVDSTQNNYEGSAGILFAIGGGAPTDSDKDGVTDKKDTCPGTPKGARVDEKGCPKDSDADGVPDGIDKCASTPKGWKVDATGCPADSDGDGVADAEDKCPNTPKEAKVNPSGCPTDDADGDGVWDGADRCPQTPKGAKVDPVGCPMDSDHDGVWDGLDLCPDTPAGAKVDDKGCPVS